VSLSVPFEQVQAAVRHGSRVVELRGDVQETVLISEVQWDSLGMDILHLDLTRVSATESIQVTLPLELRGEAPGTREGGMLEHLTHEIEIECSAAALPDRMEVSINSLHVGDAIKMGDLELPDGVTLLSDPDGVVVHCIAITPVEEEEAAAVAEVGEPEVIGRKEEAEEGGDS
jgi:large subunit ribosomal protein L25